MIVGNCTVRDDGSSNGKERCQGCGEVREDDRRRG